jgi:L-aspartate oxidase
MKAPRYLVSFHPKKIAHRFTDVLIIGGGLAGMRAAISVDPSLSVVVATKDEIRESNSNYAQGGIASVIDPEDRFESHVQDTIIAGGDLCDLDTVQMVVREGPKRIQELIEFGTNFDKQGDALVLGREGGHSFHRVVHAHGDATGREVMRAVTQYVKNQPHIRVCSNTFVLDLLTRDGECFGAILAEASGEKSILWAKQTLICTGGAGQIYRESTNPEVATADGHAIAFRAGAELRDMEFTQFHPTVLYIAGSSRSLITEAVRGEGAYLIDRNNYRFMADYDKRLELAPRDIVSQSIVTQMEKTRHPCVYLDLSHLDAAYVKQRFPGISKACAEFGLDITSDPIPVRPGAHYMIGGMTVDQEGRSSLKRLWGAGEVTSSGLHGANRLASNSLLEGLVYGAHAGLAASSAALAMPDEYAVIPLAHQMTESDDQSLDLADIRNSLKSLMWRAVGVRRLENEMDEALETVEAWQKYVLPREFDHIEGWELQNMLTVSRLMIRSAIDRKESRGVHLRVDFPQTDDANWRCHQCFVMDKMYRCPI